jgi:subtilase family serine protease
VVPTSISDFFGNGAHRAIPDVAMVGDPNTGMLVGQSQTFPDGSIRYDEYRLGGTSLSSPLLAGVVALAGQTCGSSVGFLNPVLYGAAGSSAFRDVNHGRAVTDGVVRVDFLNGFDATGGTTTSLRTFNQTGTIYTRPGYDDVTGLGSPNGTDFISAVAKG